ncbi:MAG TPA: AAA family ATPase, partial [Rhodocyclaceae bacterium]
MPSAGNPYFETERTWPFLLRQQELAECLRFLQEQTPAGPRLLRIQGPSGAGKSFFVRELLTRYADALVDGASVYVDVPASDLEASELLRKIESLLESPRTADRNSPSFVSKKLAAQWQARKRSSAGPRSAYLYRVFRDLLTLIPV